VPWWLLLPSASLMQFHHRLCATVHQIFSGASIVQQTMRTVCSRCYCGLLPLPHSIRRFRERDRTHERDHDLSLSSEREGQCHSGPTIRGSKRRSIGRRLCATVGTACGRKLLLLLFACCFFLVISMTNLLILIWP